ncbi:serine hydrolase FSH [Achaetomium macrosporum]|uniref:Serine hydrolase FSH n=1 Tax=Achaetomium macrosporum TaxID=79813 RepID=A0AAN7HAP9_9PEZI|nr:serine hydrolase FSH [Achaetomium macrosporum]
MKFLCLPGAYQSAYDFRRELVPLASEVERRGLATFAYAEAPSLVNAPPGWASYHFDMPPLFRFRDCLAADPFEPLRCVCHVPEGLSVEDETRVLQNSGRQEAWHCQDFQGSIDHISRLVEQDPEIDAVLGYSEGSMLAASYLVDQERKLEMHGQSRRIKFAVFIAGSPPLRACEMGWHLDLPTLHIFGCGDPFTNSAFAPGNVCAPNKSMVYAHGHGRIFPPHADDIDALANLLQEIIPTIEQRPDIFNQDDHGSMDDLEGQFRSLGV